VLAVGRASSVPGGAGLIGALCSPLREEAAACGGGDHGLVTRRRLRTLERIERDLAGSDPGLDALFRSFARRAGGLDMSWVEKLDRRRRRIFGGRRERGPTERMRDWIAENWKDP